MTAPAVGPTGRGGRGLLMGVVVLVVAGSLALVLAEVMLRAFGPRETRYFVSPPGQRMVLTPDTTFLPGLRGEAVISTNELGLRGDPLPADTAVFRVLVVGGSTSENLYLDDRETWTHLLQERLSPLADGRSVWVAAAARSGMSARDHAVQLPRLLDQLPRMDLVLVLVGVNDLTFALGQGDAYRMPPPLSDPAVLRAQELRAFAIVPGGLHESTTMAHTDGAWFRRTALWRLGARIRGNLAARRRSAGLVQDNRGANIERWREHRRKAAALRDTLPPLELPLEEYRRNLGRIADAAAAHGTAIAFLTQPVLWRADLDRAAADRLWLGGVGDFQRAPGMVYYTPAALARAMAAYNRALLALCAERALRCYDLGGAMPREAVNFYDDVHFSEAGSRALADSVGRWLRSVLDGR